MHFAIRTVAAACALVIAQPVAAELDLKRADVFHLQNGLTVILLEDHSLPMVSVQALYKSGSRDETTGKTGLAHFLEHLAFRGSANFRNAGATEAIYDAGGEWHGYTWIDQTTYFSSMPTGELDLLLRIEADRMAHVIIDPSAIDAEKGAVITEMHSYENDPASVLLDAVTSAAFVSHPYRNNTIGLESDVAALTLEDAKVFYERHYSPANAVLAIAGDFAPAEAKALIERHFAVLPARPAPQRVAAIEPPQRGTRRIELLGAVDRQQFEIAWPAPTASSPDFPAFLVLQQILSGGSGVNFRQNDWGTPSSEGSVLYGAADGLQTFFIPTGDRYLFTVKGSLARGATREALEAALEQRLAPIRSKPPTEELLAAAKREVAKQLTADVESTEDAAHQLAFFEGLGALDVLMSLPDRIAAVSAAQVQQVAGAYLRPEYRTIGWYMPGKASAVQALGAGTPKPAAVRTGAPSRAPPATPPDLHRLSGGLPIIVQKNPASRAVTVKLLLSGPVENGTADFPGLGLVTRAGTSGELPDLLASTHKALAVELLSRRGKPDVPSDDPETRLQQMMAERMRQEPAAELRPVVLVISGAVDAPSAYRQAERLFGGIQPAAIPKTRSLQSASGPTRTAVHIDKTLSQGALGYVVAAPQSGTREGLAWRMLLYILTHDYSGRLGRSAISDKGLIYYVGSSYPMNGGRSWITINIGVDPNKADALEAEFRRQLARLASVPPTAAEVEAARKHLLGRDLSGAQTNDEIAGKLIRNFVETGGLRTHAKLKAMLDTITPADVAAAVPAFTRGTILRVDVGAR